MLSEFCPDICPWTDTAVALPMFLRMDQIDVITYKYVIIIDYYMTVFILHVISTLDAHISPRAEGPRANMGRGLIWHVI